MSIFLQLLVQGVALGCIYALIALGFTVALMAGVVNFAQGSFMLVGAYTVSWLALSVQLPFIVALGLGCGAVAVLGMGFERFILRHISARPALTIIMLTLGLDIILRVLTVLIWGHDPRSNGDPFGPTGENIGEIRINWADLWILITTLGLLIFFFLFYKYTKYGIAMRAVALDHEAAAAVGISLPQIYMITWAITGIVATVGGVFLAASPRVLDSNLGFTALRAFPAVILGGLGSPVGAVLGGLILGLVEVLVSGYVGNGPNQYLGFLGNGFYEVATYVVLLLVLLIRPYGLLGQKETQRF